jgi:response regulator RpfG family c-di-GMP phosphodiesterase
MSDDELLFAKDEEQGGDGTAQEAEFREPWKVLIVDDEPEVHRVTRMVLADFKLDGRGLSLFSAHSRREAEELLSQHDDFAVTLLDVVMEEEDAGLRLVRHIRETLGNRTLRIILRTGQPGQAPEREVVLAYDINDYKSKTELTSQKLFTTLVAALRSWRDIINIEQNRQGLERIIHGFSALYEKRSLSEFLSGVLTQLRALVLPAKGLMICAAGPGDKGFKVVAAEGVYSGFVGKSAAETLPEEILKDLDQAARTQQDVLRDEHGVVFFRSRSHSTTLLHMRLDRPLDPVNRTLLELFCGKASIGLDNVFLFDQVKKAQQATVVALADLAEFKDRDTGDHVRRIDRMATATVLELLKRGLFKEALNEEFIEMIGVASILHDVGKVGIPDTILNKPGMLTTEEREVMKSHADLGARILEKAAAMVEGYNYLNMAVDVAASHHEKFDGSGYLRGLANHNIPLSGRIVAVADVYDALVSERPYKKAWPVKKAIDLIREESGRAFDPQVVEAFIAAVAEK